MNGLKRNNLPTKFSDLPLHGFYEKKNLLSYHENANWAHFIVLRLKSHRIIESKRPRSQILTFLYFSSFVFKENHVFNEQDYPSEKVLLVEEELNDIDIDDIKNLGDLPELMFIDEKMLK